MVKGLDVFRKHFKDFQQSYVLIGGVACYLNMEEAGLDFRATRISKTAQGTSNSTVSINRPTTATPTCSNCSHECRIN